MLSVIVLHAILEVGAGCLQFRYAVDDIDREIVAVDLIADREL